MRPAELIKFLSVTIPARLPVLIKGAPGVGKSDIVTLAAEAAGANLVLMHPVVSDPTDFKGLPAVVNGKADFLPFGDLEKLVNAKTDTLAFLDDLGQAPAVVQAAAMQLILARQVNGHRISDKVTFVAATNRREDKAAVTGILEPVKSRFASIVELAPEVDDWCKWALTEGDDGEPRMPVELVAFVRFQPQKFTTPEKVTNDIVNRVSPRTVANLGKLYRAGVRDYEALAGACGAGFASEFIGFCKVWMSMPSIDGILLNPEKAGVPEDPAALYAVSVGLASKASKANVGRIIKYANRLPQEFGVLCIRDSVNRNGAVQETKEFMAWGAANAPMLS